MSAMAPPISIIPLSSLALEAATCLHAAAFAEEAWTSTALAELLAMPSVFGRLALTASDVPVAFLLALRVADEVEILTICVDPAYQRRGFATLLMEDFFAKAKTTGAINAFLEVATDNRAGIALYRRLGFQKLATRRHYYRRSGNILVDAIVLSRNLI